MNIKISIPMTEHIVVEDIWLWYLNIFHEIQENFLSPNEKNYLATYYEEAGLLRKWRRPFFRQHFCVTFMQTVTFLMEGKNHPTILDLGCGFGTQSLYLALMGARVVALDMDKIALGIFEKRLNFYQREVQRKLNVSIHCTDAFAFDYDSIAPIDGMFSMFAFNMMQPSDQLLSMMQSHFGHGGRIAILDGNNHSWLSLIAPSRQRQVWSPLEFRQALKDFSFNVKEHRGGIVLPPLLWALGASKVLFVIDRVLGRNWFLPISHYILAERSE